MNYSFVKDKISIFNKIAQEFGFPKVYAVGGLCRDLVFSEGSLSEINDIDLTCCAGPKTTILGILISKEMNGKILYFNNHCSIIIDDIKYDFSSGFISNGAKSKFTDRFDLEMYSRDFTIDALLLDTESDTIVDVTKKGVRDIEEGIIRPVISAKETYMSDPKRALRAVEMSTRFGFKITSESFEFFDKNFDFFNKFHNENSGNSVNMVMKAIENNSAEAIRLLRSTKFMYQIPLSGEYKDFIIKNNLVEEYFDNMITPSSDMII